MVIKIREEWRDIEEFFGSYQISNLGTVRSIPRMRRNGTGQRQHPGMLLTIRIDRYGYPVVLFTHNAPAEEPLPNHLSRIWSRPLVGSGPLQPMVRCSFLVLVLIIGILFSNKVASARSEPPTKSSVASQIKTIHVIDVAHDIQPFKMRLYNSWLSIVQWLTNMKRDLIALPWVQANVFNVGQGRTFHVKRRHGQGIVSKEDKAVTFANLRNSIANIDDGKRDIYGGGLVLEQAVRISRAKGDWINRNVTYPQFWSLREKKGLVSNFGLVSDSVPLAPRKIGINGGSSSRKEICNDGQGLITGHWGLGIILCLIGLSCCAQAFRVSGFAPTISDFGRYAGYQLLFVVFFGIGMYGLISTTFKDCEMTPNQRIRLLFATFLQDGRGHTFPAFQIREHAEENRKDE